MGGAERGPDETAAGAAPIPRASALAPYRVLDLTGALGALCGRVLAGLGADVIKIERPGGDPARAAGPFAGATAHPHRSLPWIFANAGKRGVTLDLERAEGRELLRALVPTADFLVESFPPGYLALRDLGDACLQRLNPALVIVHVSPFGQTGPYRDYQATDIVLWAMGGQMALDGDADRAPLRLTAPQVDLLAGAHAAAAAMTAHYMRTRTGRGQVVDVAAQECVTWTLMIAAQTWDISHINPQRGGAVRRTVRADGTALNHRSLWPCRDGFVLWGLGGGTQTGTLTSTRALVAWMAEEGVPETPTDVDWQALSAALLDQDTYDRLSRPFHEFFSRHTKRALFEGALARSIQLAPVNEIPDVAASPQLAARSFWHAVELPMAGTVLQFPGAPVKLSRTPWLPPSAAPLPGQHNGAVYKDLIGLTDNDVRRLEEAGVL